MSENGQPPAPDSGTGPVRTRFSAVPKSEAGEVGDEAPAPASPQRRNPFDLQEGWLGILLLVVVAAFFGGLMATFWPVLVGRGDDGATGERLAALETRIGQLAAGQAPEAASAAFEDLRRDLAALAAQIRADEARLTALEELPDADAPADLAPFSLRLDNIASQLAGFETRLAAVESRPAQVEDGGAAEQAAANAERVAALAADVEALRVSLGEAAAALNDAAAAVAARVARLEATAPPADLAARLERLAAKDDLAALATRLEALEKQDVAGALRRAAAALALANLARAASEGRPFALELDAFAAASPGDPALDELRRLAERGTATRAMLKARFPVVIEAAIKADRAGRAENWLERLWLNLASLVTVRRIGDVEGTDAESRLARAETRMNEDDLAAAVAELSALDGPAAAAVASWLAEAQARLVLDRTLARASERLIDRLAAPAGEAGRGG